MKRSNKLSINQQSQICDNNKISKSILGAQLERMREDIFNLNTAKDESSSLDDTCRNFSRKSSKQDSNKYSNFVHKNQLGLRRVL